jgi:hypothetical protein
VPVYIKRGKKYRTKNCVKKKKERREITRPKHRNEDDVYKRKKKLKI